MQEAFKQFEAGVRNPVKMSVKAAGGQQSQVEFIGDAAEMAELSFFRVNKRFSGCT